MRSLWRSLIILSLLLAPAGFPLAAPQVSDTQALAALRREIEELRAQIRALQDQVTAMAGTMRPAAPPSPASSAQPAEAASTSAPAGPPPGVSPEAPAPSPAGTETGAIQPSGSLAGSTRAGSSIFNPAISAVFELIGSGSLSHDAEDEGFSLTEAEIALQSVVDPYARVDLFVALGADGEAEVEEGTVTSTGLAGGLQLKGGRFKNALGKWNLLHQHQFYTVDSPDVLQAMFGEESLASDGLSMSWLIPGTRSLFLESTTEVGNTANEISFNAEGGDPMVLQRLGAVFTLTGNATLGVGGTAALGRAGPTEALVDAIDEAGLGGTLDPGTKLRSRLAAADVTWKWKPLSRNVYRSAVVQAEAIASRRDIEMLEGASLRRVTSDVWGGYAYGEYQFAKRWRAGLRYDRTGFPGLEDAGQRALSGVLRISPTEFQEFRIQFKRTTRSLDAALLFDGERDDHQVYFEWIPAIGAHAAHPY